MGSFEAPAAPAPASNAPATDDPATPARRGYIVLADDETTQEASSQRSPRRLQAPRRRYLMVVLGSRPCRMQCPYCGARIQTATRSVRGQTFWLIFIILIFVICLYALIMLSMDVCQETEHYCPNCNAFIGRSAAD
ncbi:hypothetical protein L596_030400 [Steinernema carpocapsae]|uniref:LITAF domain-containing protein n=1 Tax=Steinernema carpocapsae TaxID=34508 RepID=A0A4U5LPB2_STECR|nr:hypothetical protein L596_030400 [Steinernema carpocapsae]